MEVTSSGIFGEHTPANRHEESSWKSQEPVREENLKTWNVPARSLHVPVGDFQMKTTSVLQAP
jgi:hypothetical protein